MLNPHLQGLALNEYYLSNFIKNRAEVINTIFLESLSKSLLLIYDKNILNN